MKSLIFKCCNLHKTYLFIIILNFEKAVKKQIKILFLLSIIIDVSAENSENKNFLEENGHLSEASFRLNT